MLFLPYFFTAINFFFFSVFLYTWGFVWFQNKLWTLSKNRLINYLCVHTHFCVWCTCVCVCVTCTQACTYRREGCAWVNHGLRAWIFHTSPFQLMLPMQFSNYLLLSRHTFFHAFCPVVLPGERLLFLCKSHFPYLHYRHLFNIINISSEFLWHVQDSCKSDRTTNYVFVTANIPFLTYCIHLCVLTA